MEQEEKQDHSCGAIVRIEDGGLGSIDEDMVDVKKRKFNDVDLQDDEQGLSSSSLSGSSSSSGTEAEDNLKKKAKFDLEKVDEQEEEEDEEEDEESDEEESYDNEESDEEESEEDDLEEKEVEEGSTFTSKEVQKVELKPEEYAYEPSEEEKKYHESPSYLARPIVLKSTVDEEGSIDYYFMTERELQFIKQMIEESEGFDVPLIPGAVLPGGKFPNNLSDKGTARYFAKISKLALKYYNKKHGTDYALKCLVKSNAATCNFVTYYITFKATSGVHSGQNVTFQAKVSRARISDDIHVMLCRIKS